MSKLITFFTVFFFIAKVSCFNKENLTNENNFPLKFINIWRNEYSIDTTYSKMNSITFKDSIYYLKYTEIDFNGDTIQLDYEFPISNSAQTQIHLKDTSEYRFRYVGLRYLRYENKNYIAYKYLFDDPKGNDEEMNYYFIPEYGIVIIRSQAWGSYGRLISNSNKNDSDKIFYLTEKIVNDFYDFYFPYQE